MIVQKLISKVLIKTRQELNYRRATCSIIVAGLGRCGSTLMYNAIQDYGYRKRNFFLAKFPDSNIYKVGNAYKTHACPPKKLPANVKLIFLFANPMNVAISATEQINKWGVSHYHHMGAEGYESNEQLLTADLLNLHALFDVWHRPQSFEFFSIKYESLYQAQTLTALKAYLGFAPLLPIFKERRADWKTHPMRETLLDVYGELYQQIAAADDYKLWHPKSTEVSQ